MLPVMFMNPHAKKIPGYFEENCTMVLNGIFLVFVHLNLKQSLFTLTVANLHMGPGDLPKLQLMLKQQRLVPSEETAALEGELYGVISSEVPPSLPEHCSTQALLPNLQEFSNLELATLPAFNQFIQPHNSYIIPSKKGNCFPSHSYSCPIQNASLWVSLLKRYYITKCTNPAVRKCL